MALQDDFENTRSSLFRRHPLLAMDNALTELISKETQLAMTRTHHQDNVVAITPKHCTSFAQPCHQCGRSNHLVVQCKANFHSNSMRLSSSKLRGLIQLQYLPQLPLVHNVEEPIILSSNARLYIIVMEHDFLLLEQPWLLQHLTLNLSPLSLHLTNLHSQ